MTNQDYYKGESMYRLRDLKNGLYQIHKRDGKAFEGNLEVIKLAAVGMGIKSQEFDIAVFELEYQDHDYAEFGIWGRFVFTQSDRRAA